MAIDNKYGRVTVEHPGPGEDEPVVVFRAQDAIMPNVLRFYYEECERNGAPEHHLALLRDTLSKVLDWQFEHHDQVRVPNSNRYAERMDMFSPPRRVVTDNPQG